MEGYDVTVLGSFYGHRTLHLYPDHTAPLTRQLLSFDDSVYLPTATPLDMPFPLHGNQVSVTVLLQVGLSVFL